MNNTTRISDLPDNITMQPTKHDNLVDPSQSTNYIPINVHPNPYGVSPQNPIMPQMQQAPNVQQMQQVQQLEQMSNTIREPLSEEQMAELQNMRQMRLPSKDVRIDTQDYMHDEAVQPNYIPKQKLTKDYILDYEEEFEKKHQENEKKKHRESKIDELLTELRVPIMVAVLFLVFQLPIVNTQVFKRFSFLSIYHEDGNFNFYGLVFKSSLFGAIYYFTQKVIEYLGDL
jgi:hypothetical protein